MLEVGHVRVIQNISQQNLVKSAQPHCKKLRAVSLQDANTRFKKAMTQNKSALSPTVAC